MEEIREIDTLNDGPEAERWRSIIEKLTREGEQLATAVEVADLVVRVRRDAETETAPSQRSL